MRRFLGPVLLLAFLAGAVAVSTSDARAEVSLVSQSVENGFPSSITFRVQVEAPGGVSEATLRYTLAGSGSGGFNRPESIPPGDEVTIELSLVTNTLASYIPVGSLFRYSWEVEAGDGSVLVTPEQEFLYLPPNREWKVAANEIMEVWYHGDRDATANQYLQAATETYRTFTSLLGAELRSLPVRVVLFATESEMDPAKRGMGTGGRDEQVAVCGQQVSPVVVFVRAGTCGTNDVTDTLRHELVHIIVEEAQGLVQIPLWLNEGLAVAGQSEPGQGFTGPFQAAVRTDRLIPFVQMTRPAADPAQVGLYYGQAYVMTSYLLDRYGPTAMGDLFAALRAGSRFDAAFEDIYGADLATFENEFRESVGLGPVTSPTAAPTQPPERPAEATPTIAPAPQQSGGSGGGRDISPVFLGSLGVAVFFALLAMFFLLFSMMQKNSRAAAATPGGPAAHPPAAAAARPAPPAAPPPPPSPPPRSERPPPAWRPVNPAEPPTEPPTPEGGSGRVEADDPGTTQEDG